MRPHLAIAALTAMFAGSVNVGTGGGGRGRMGGTRMTAQDRDEWKQRHRIANAPTSHAERLAAAQAKRDRKAAKRRGVKP